MHFSRAVKSSSHSLPSPNGRLIATLHTTAVHIREVQTFEVVRTIELPRDCSGPVFGFRWSPSSRLLLVAFLSQVHVFSARDDSFHATVNNTLVPGAKPTYVAFGASDAQVIIVSSLGLKLTLFDLVSSQGVEIANPKFFTTLTSPKGFSFRPQTRHLALLTRSAGKDWISVHDPLTSDLQRSWAPDTIDAQGLAWSPDGRWLVLWESPAHGHKVLFYTPDGHVFKSWLRPSSQLSKDKDVELGAGVKGMSFSPNGSSLAIGDSSRSVYIFSLMPVSETMHLAHPTTITPKDTLQVWQEQVSVPHAGPLMRSFAKATQTISPTGMPTKDNSEVRTGCSLLLFDSSSTLLTTRLEDSPATAWVWDVASAELRAVLLFHAPISSIVWHPQIRETLLVRCEGDQYDNLVFAWDPLSEGPQSIDFSGQLSRTESTGRVYASWLNLEQSRTPSVFYSNGKNWALALLGEIEEDAAPWPRLNNPSGSSPTRREESPLDLVPAVDQGSLTDEDEDYSELEDTFVHKR